jgi:hypothetical protein
MKERANEFLYINWRLERLPNSLGIWPDNILYHKYLKTPTRIGAQDLYQQWNKNLIHIIWYTEEIVI